VVYSKWYRVTPNDHRSWPIPTGGHLPIVGNDSLWPVVVETTSGQLTDEDVQRYNARRAQRLLRAEKHVQILEAVQAMRMSSRHRKTIADFDARHREEQRRYLAGVALVTSSALLRLVLAAIYRLTPAVCPRKPCGSVAEATSWAHGLLALGGRGQRHDL
jgi:hypothetical protein